MVLLIPHKYQRNRIERCFIQLLVDITTIIGAGSIVQGALTQSFQGSSVDLFNGNISCNAIIEYGAPAAAVTGCTVQIEEWSGVTNGTGNGGTTWQAIPNMVAASVTTGPTRQTLMGLRTQRYARANAITFAVGTTANVPLTVEILEMPKSEGGSETPNVGQGYSNWPSSGSTIGL